MASRSYDWKREIKREYLSESDDERDPEPPANFVQYRHDFTIDDEDARRLHALSQFEREREFERRIWDHEKQQIRRNVYEKNLQRMHNNNHYKKPRLEGPRTTNFEIDTGPVVVINECEPHVKIEVKQEASEALPDENVLIVEDVFKKEDVEDGELTSSTSCSSAGSSRSNSPERGVTVKVSTKEQLDKARLSRRDLAKFCHAPFFKPYAIGCLVRTCTDGAIDALNDFDDDGRVCQVYKIVDIIECDEGNDAYDLEMTRTNVLLRLKYGDQENNYPMNLVSNFAITDDEFRHWTGFNSDYVSLNDVEKKEQDIKEMRSREMTEADVSYMIKSKKRFRKFDGPNAEMKRMLIKEINEATEAGHMDTAVRCRARLKALEHEWTWTSAKSKDVPILYGQPKHNDVVYRKSRPVNRNHVAKPKNEDYDDTPFVRKSRRARKPEKQCVPSPSCATTTNSEMKIGNKSATANLMAVKVKLRSACPRPVFMYSQEEVVAELESLMRQFEGSEML